MSKPDKGHAVFGVTLADMQRWFLNQQVIAVTSDSIYLGNRSVIKFTSLAATNTELVEITQSFKVGKQWFIDRVGETTPLVLDDGSQKYQFVLYRGSQALVRVHMLWSPAAGQSEDWRGVKAQRYNYAGTVDCHGKTVCERHDKTVTLTDITRLLTGAVFDRYDREYGYVFTNGLRMKPFYGGELAVAAIEGDTRLGAINGIVWKNLIEEYPKCYLTASQDRWVSLYVGGQVLTRLRARPSREGGYVRWNVPCTFWLPAAKLHRR